MTQLAYLVMPLWQGSSSSRAMQLIDGADAIRRDLPAQARHEIPVPLEAGDMLGTPIARLSSLLRARESAREVLGSFDGSRVSITVGGDCTSALPGLESAIDQHGPEDLTVLWFDAHADLQHPSTSPTGAAAGMALRHALGDGSEELRFTTPLRDDALSLIGTRSLDPEEHEEVVKRGIEVIDGGAHGTSELAEVVANTVEARGTRRLYIHVDLDVLDPAEFTSVHTPVPFGLSVAHLTESIRAALQVAPLAGAAICGFQPQDASAAGEGLPTVLRVLAALTSGSPR